MLRRVVSAKERWEGIDERLRDLLITFIGLNIFCYFFYFSFRSNPASISSYVSLLSICLILVAVAYFFVKSEFSHRKTAIVTAIGVGVFMFTLVALAMAVTGYIPEKPEESVLYLVLGVPVVASIFYIVTGGAITLILVILGMSEEPKSEEEIINEVVGEDEEREKQAEDTYDDR